MLKKVVLADWEELYLNELSYGFMEKDPQLELFTFSKKELLYQYFRDGETADVLVVDEKLVDAELAALTSGMTRIVMSVSMTPIEGFYLLKKYQKNETLLHEIKLRYAEDSGSVESIRGNSKTKIAAFYSPAGGTGKTTLALAAAIAGSAAGYRTLYLNLEEIDSVSSVLPKTSGTLSDVFLALKTKGMNVGIKMQGCIGTESGSGFFYLSGVESISEHQEIDGQELKKLIGQIRDLSEFELVFLDLSSGFTEKTCCVLEETEKIFVPLTASENAALKLRRFLNESSLHRMYEPVMKRMCLLENGVVANRQGETLSNRLFPELPCCGAVPAARELSSYRTLLKEGRSAARLLDPVLAAMLQEREE